MPGSGPLPPGSATRAPIADHAASMASRRAGHSARRRAATPAIRTLARAIPPITLSKGPTPWAEMKNGSVAPVASGERGLSVRATTSAPRFASPASQADEGTLVAANVDGDQGVARFEAGQGPAHRHLRTAEQGDAVTELAELGGQQHADRGGHFRGKTQTR